MNHNLLIILLFRMHNQANTKFLKILIIIILLLSPYNVKILQLIVKLM